MGNIVGTKVLNLTDYFDCTRIINLAHRDDRRKEVAEELKRLSMTIGKNGLSFFAAVKPETSAGFPTVGARGCYMSHLEVLKQAHEHGVNRLLILEDDVNFIKKTNDKLESMLSELSGVQWDICYLGHQLSLNNPEDGKLFQYYDGAIQTTHSYAVKSQVLPELIAFLEAILTREPGDPLGGPMHFDGALNTFRAQNPKTKTVVLCEALTYQRPSKTDIHELFWFDKLPVIRHCVAIVRRLKNVLKAKLSSN